MKLFKNVFVLLLLMLPLQLFAQSRYGYFSYKAVTDSLPDMVAARQSYDILKGKYAAEIKRTEDEFNRKYADFLAGQKDFPQNILLKRQRELQQLMEAGIAFRKDCDKQLAEAEKNIYAPVKDRIQMAISAVGTEGGYDFILNTDANAFPYINAGRGEDVTQKIRAKLSAKE